jgi:DNA-directed RNA polymerase specialized sigma24 family protein
MDARIELLSLEPEQWSADDETAASLLLRRKPELWCEEEVVVGRTWFDRLGRRPVLLWGPARSLAVRLWVVSAPGHVPFLRACFRGADGIAARDRERAMRALGDAANVRAVIKRLREQRAEVAQDAFSDLNRVMSTDADFFDGYEPALSYGLIGPWLRQRFLSHARAFALLEFRQLLLAAVGGPRDAANDPNEASPISRSLDPARVQQLLPELPPTWRVAVNLHDLQGLAPREMIDHPETMVFRSRTVGAFRTALCRGRQRLRELFEVHDWQTEVKP